ncbi:MAG: cytochrome b/b6 domain-containing protein [Sulfuricurvum sp.]|nr:cytochrome b/b6 domain-containing protein [Sulfuricurvum sp.]
MKRVYVWTLPTRLFHWLFVAFIIAAWISADEDRWLSIHVALGSALAGLLIFRIIWGIMGPKYSKFSDFNFQISGLKEYIAGIFHPSRHYVGHNPAASYIMIAMFITVGLAIVSGFLVYGIQENRGILAFLHARAFGEMDLFKEVHEFFVNILWVLIALHVSGVLMNRLLHAEDGTLTSIFDGYKNIKSDNVRLSLLQKIVAIIGITGSIVILVYALSVPNNPLVVSHTLHIDYTKEHKLFVNECASCHTLYPPSLLPKQSWVKLMGDLSNHFGDDASLEPADNRSILAYLLAHSAESSKQEMSVKIMQTLQNRDIIAITQTPFWKRTHRHIPIEVFQGDLVKSRANCKACHSDVEQGLIEDNAIRPIAMKV